MLRRVTASHRYRLTSIRDGPTSPRRLPSSSVGETARPVDPFADVRIVGAGKVVRVVKLLMLVALATADPKRQASGTKVVPIELRVVVEIIPISAARNCDGQWLDLQSSVPLSTQLGR